METFEDVIGSKVSVGFEVTRSPGGTRRFAPSEFHLAVKSLLSEIEGGNEFVELNLLMVDSLESIGKVGAGHWQRLVACGDDGMVFSKFQEVTDQVAIVHGIEDHWPL